MEVTLKSSLPKNGWVAFWAVDQYGRHLHTEPVCTIPVGYGHQWFASYLEGLKVEAPMIPLKDPEPEELVHSEMRIDNSAVDKKIYRHIPD